jgi:hypothetical protein
MITAMCVLEPSAGNALQVQLSNPYYRVSSIVSESSNGEDVTDSFEDEQSNTTGLPVSVFVDTSYASATADVLEPFGFSASSSISGFTALQAGLASATAEGGFWFETDISVSGDAGQARVEIRYVVSQSFLSTDPKFHPLYDADGTTAASSSSLAVFSGFDILAADPGLEPGEHVLSAVVDVGAVYRLQTDMNASSTAEGTTGSASAAVTLKILSVSAQLVPEPTTGMLLGLGLAALALARPSRRARSRGDW